MAAVDTRLFKLFFEAIERFYKTPDIGFVVTSGRFISKKATLRFFRNLLPQYRAITDDNELIEQLYLNQAVDFNLRNLLLQKEPVLPENLHREFDQIGKLSQDKQDQALIKWVEGVRKFPRTTSEQTYNQQTTPSRQPIKLPNLLKNLPVFKISPQAAMTVFSAGVGSIAGYGAAGGTGAAAGALIGAAVPSFIKSGGGEILLRGGGAMLNTTANLLSGINLVKVGIPLVGSPVLIWGLVIGLGLILLTGLISTTGLTPAVTTPGVGATPITPSAPGAGAGVISCPVKNGRVTAGSKDAGGHCSPGYETDFPCAVPDTTGRATAVDLTNSQGTDRSVSLPYISGQTVNWFIERVGTNTDYVRGGVRVSGGFEVIARTEDYKYRIRFIHLESPNITEGQLASSGIVTGLYRTTENHVHVTIQETDVFKPVDLYFNVCQ